MMSAAASFVTSVPVRPMATPMDAAFSAGASIHAIPCHRHNGALCLPVLYDAQLVLGRDARVDGDLGDALGEFLSAHGAHRQGAGLVTADDLRAAEGLNGWQAPHHALHSEG